MTYLVKSPIIDGQRQCTCCHGVKPLEEFYEKPNPKRNPGRRHESLHYAECKDCFKKRKRQCHQTARGL